MENKEFSNMGLKEELLEMIKAKGFICPTPIQIEAIPWALKGKDIMGQAQTGTGKTAAFGLPILNKIEKGAGLQALVLCPTRELAVQVMREISFLGKKMMIGVVAIYGGQPIERQVYALKKRPEIVVGTPGRILDHLRRNTISFSGVKFLVLDEADEMLDMGFLPDIERILRFCPLERQTFLFSATLSEKVRKLAFRYMQNPKIIVIPSPERTVPMIEQKYYMVKPGFKNEALCAVLDNSQISACLIFCRTKISTSNLAKILRKKGYEAGCLHGDMSQRERDWVMSAFRSRSISILAATDLAARGIDIKHVSHVINYDIPEDPESYVHRIGRTGRAGRKGTAITLVEPEQINRLRAIENYTGKRIKRDILNVNNEKLQEKQLLRMEKLIKDKMTEKSDEMSFVLALKLMKEYRTEDLVKTLLNIIWQEFRLEEIENGAVEELEMVNVEIPWGKVHGADADNIIRFLVDNTALSLNEIGEIEIGKEECYIEVPLSQVDAVYKAMNDFKPGRQRKGNFFKYNSGLPDELCQ
ncbi:DEAD/DEAH box helicase [Thermosyntropha sp.]|uniref:DEAD/DEAH box helicase n=1 Tax=Thermosyntropha sp. TaxID=2740820 RepID=UPI0025CC615B|nr:DEAD/DEAH box helicase [Thermosyntropha sp.]MBO8158219.1 DEAD/DEAH box helicase [Thermosyntropha sp.]